MVRPRSPEAAKSVSPWSDVGGLLLAACLAGWIAVSATSSADSAVGPIGTLTAALLGYVAARSIARRWRWVIPVTIVVTIVALGASTWRDLLARDPIGGPLAYQNANAALFLQGFVASLVLVALARSWWRIVAATVAALLAIALVIIGSTAAVGLAVMVGSVGVAALIGVRITPTSAITGGFLICLVASVVLGATYQPRPGGGVTDPVASSSTEMRLALWHDAWMLAVDHPIFGIGAGRFAAESEAAASDPDTRQAHQEFLQLGAESGIVGGVLLAALFVWAIARAGLDRGPIGATVAAGIAALAIHACIDYVLHFPLVPVASAILAGAASLHDPKSGSTPDEPVDVPPLATTEDGSDA